MTALSIHCRHCGAPNEFIVQGAIWGAETVACSSCRQSLGAWGELMHPPAPAAGSTPVSDTLEPTAA